MQKAVSPLVIGITALYGVKDDVLFVVIVSFYFKDIHKHSIFKYIVDYSIVCRDMPRPCDICASAQWLGMP